VLQKNSHQVRDHYDRQEHITKLGSTSQVGRPVSRVHITDSDQKARTRKGKEFAPEICRCIYSYRCIYFRHRLGRGLGMPTIFIRIEFITGCFIMGFFNHSIIIVLISHLYFLLLIFCKHFFWTFCFLSGALLFKTIQVTVSRLIQTMVLISSSVVCANIRSN
jgi:hypothetical protein